MCGYAAGQAKAAGVTLDVVEADMRDFRVAGPDGARVLFDAAVTMLNSACHLFTLDDLVRHLTAVRAHLVAGGLYIVELAHPADFFAAGAAHEQRVDGRRPGRARRRPLGRPAATGSTR